MFPSNSHSHSQQSESAHTRNEQSLTATHSSSTLTEKKGVAHDNNKPYPTLSIPHHFEEQPRLQPQDSHLESATQRFPRSPPGVSFPTPAPLGNQTPSAPRLGLPASQTILRWYTNILWYFFQLTNQYRLAYRLTRKLNTAYMVIAKRNMILSRAVKYLSTVLFMLFHNIHLWDVFQYTNSLCHSINSMFDMEEARLGIVPQSY